MKIEPQMTGMPPAAQAKKAIRHTLRNIAERPAVAWYLGHGTQTYALLTEAHATLNGITIEEVRKNWPPSEPRKFSPDELRECPFCGSSFISKCETSIDYAFECNDCDAIGPEADTEDAAREKWNARQMPR
jgi:Lar family restriction alleviation protein